MGDVAVDFGKQFHNLEGNLIGERKKNFFKLLQNKSLFSNEEQLITTLKNLEPKTYLESLLHIDMLIYFKRTEELLKTFKKGNEVFISKIIKQPWFFKEAFVNISAEELVNDFLPCISFVTRTKVLKKLSITLSEVQMDEVFECLHKRYGLQVALNIVHSCSSKKIIEIISTNETDLRPNQVKMLFDKDQKVFKLYLDNYKKNRGRAYDNKNVFRHVALKNHNLLLELNKEKKLCMHSVGRRASKKIVDNVKSDITHNIQLYTSLLKHEVIVRRLGDNFKDVYFKLFPKKMANINNYGLAKILLNFYPKKRRWSLFSQAFSTVFKDQSVTDNLNLLDSDILHMSPPKEVRQKWGKIKYNSEYDDSFLTYFDPSESIPLIKEKINVTSKIYERFNLIKQMIDSCVVNEDIDSFEKVLEYVCFRHRNEEVRMRQDFLLHIKCNLERRNKFDDLSENHWKYINELIEVLRITNEYNSYTCSMLDRKYLEYLFKNGKPFRKEILQYAKDVIVDMDTFLPRIDNPAVEKQILTQIMNVLPELVDNETEEKCRSIYSILVHDIVRFNESNVNSDHCMSLMDFPVLIQFINSLLDKDANYHDYRVIERVIRYNYQFPQYAVNIDNAKLMRIIAKSTSDDEFRFYFRDLIEFMVMKKNRSESENQILQFYFNETVDKHVSEKIGGWFLKNEPLAIIPYFDKIIGTLAIEEIKLIKLYSHFNFDAKSIAFLKTRLTDQNDLMVSDRKKFVTYLAVLLPTKEFIDVVMEDFPKKEKLDLQDKEMKGIYNLQREFAKNLKNVVDPGSMLPTVMKFCAGDYLPPALRSLYSICYRAPEKQLYFHMDILSKKAVSARKHALYISCALLEYKYAVNQLKTALHNNTSSQKQIFSETLKYFLKNPMQELFDMIISCLNMIDKNDTETLDKLSSLDCPKKYRAVFVEKCWEFFENMRKHKELKVNKHLRKLLLVILNSSDILIAFPSAFCRKILDDYFKDRKDDLLNVELFVCNVLRYREMEQVENFRHVFEILSKFKVNKERDLIKRFFEKFYVVVTEDMNGNFLNIFTEYWGRLFTPMQMFDEYILLKLLNVGCKAGEPFIENYAKAVVSFLDELIAEYGLHVHSKFKDQLVKALGSTFEKEKDKYLFFYSILTFKTTTTTSILVLDIMSKVKKDYTSKEIFDIFNNITRILEGVEDPIVKIYYKSYMSS